MSSMSSRIMATARTHLITPLCLGVCGKKHVCQIRVPDLSPLAVVLIRPHRMPIQVCTVLYSVVCSFSPG